MTPRVRGRSALVRQDGSLICDDVWLDDRGPGSTLTYDGVRYEVVKPLWFGEYTPSCYIVKEVPYEKSVTTR